MKLLSFFFIIIILFPGPFFNVDEKQNAAIILLRFCILSTVVMIMFLSMQIILNGLHEYKCDAHITSSEMRIWSLDPGLNIPHWAAAALVISKELIG